MTRMFKNKESDYPYYVNPYYNPKECGLEIVTSLEEDEAYQFDMIVVWKDTETGKLYMAQDSGCSCPTPFEETNSLSDLTELESVEQFRSYVKKVDLRVPLRDVEYSIRKVEEAL